MNQDASPPPDPVRRITRWSALTYLQKKVAERCARLPYQFESIEAWTAFRGGLVPFLREKLPVWETSDALPDQRTAEFDLGEDLVLETVDVHFDDGFFIPIHLYRPKAADSALPAALVCHGYGGAKNSGDTADMCIALARNGIMAAAPDYDAAGERKDRPDLHTDTNNVCALACLLGVNDVALRVMNNLAVLRCLKERDDVDAKRIGITGLCQGAIVTWFTAAVCEEFAVIAPLCGATSYEAVALEYCNRQGGWSGISPYVFDLLAGGDVPHVLAACAPRPLLVQNNIIDVHWPYSGFQQTKALCERVYELHGAADRCRFKLEHGPHAYAPPFIANIVGWFERFL